MQIKGAQRARSKERRVKDATQKAQRQESSATSTSKKAQKKEIESKSAAKRGQCKDHSNKKAAQPARCKERIKRLDKCVAQKSLRKKLRKDLCAKSAAQRALRKRTLQEECCAKIAVRRGGGLRTFGGPKKSTVQSSIFRPKVLWANFQNLSNFQKCENSHIELLKKMKVFALAKVRRSSMREFSHFCKVRKFARRIFGLKIFGMVQSSEKCALPPSERGAKSAE